MATALAGFASDLAATLPPNDPWRYAHPDAFGSIDDHTDLIPEFGDSPVGADWPLVAVRGGLSPHAVTIVLGAFDPEALTEHLSQRIAGDPAAATEEFGDAVRWLVFRRRAFTGDYVDTWILKSASYWVDRDAAETSADVLDDGSHQREIAKNLIDASLYNPEARFAADFADFTEEEVERFIQ